MKVKRCRLILASLTLVMFFGFSPFDWLTLVTDYFAYQSGTVVQQSVPQNQASGDGTATRGAQPSSSDSGGGQCPLCPGPRPRPRPIPPGL
jgi:hypothetical protein